MNIIFIKDFIRLTRKKMFSLLILISLILILSIVFQIYAQISEILVPEIRERIENRMIYISEIENLRELENIVKVKSGNKLIHYVSNVNIYNNHLGDISISTKLPNEKIEIIKGRNLVNKKNEIIISEALAEERGELINSDVELIFENEKIKCRVVGYYKSYMLNFKDKVYISEGISNQIMTSNNEYIAVIEHQRFVEDTIRQLQFYKIKAQLFDNSYTEELNTYNQLLNIIDLFTGITILIFIISSFIFINDFIREKLIAIIILKLSGYNNFQVSMNVFLAIFILILITCSVFNVILIIFSVFLKEVFSITLTYFFTYSISAFLLVVFITFMVILILIHKIKNKKILKVLYEA